MNENDIFDDMEDTYAEGWTPDEDDDDADLDDQVGRMTDKDTPLGRSHASDIGDGLYEPAEKYDLVEEQSRGRDYENLYGRVRTGREGEIDLSRVSLEGGTRLSGGTGDDWSTNPAQSFVHDTRGSTSQQGAHEDVDPELHRELRGAGLRLGVNGVNTQAAGFAMASAQYARNKERWRRYSPEYKSHLNAMRRTQRANRDWEQVREDSITRNYREVFNGFLDDRTAEDPYWTYIDPAEIERMDEIDGRSARQVADRWRLEVDEREMRALVVRYSAFLSGIKPDSIRARFKRKPHERELAEFVFVTDALACGVAFPSGFAEGVLVNSPGDELCTQTETSRSNQERRDYIVSVMESFFAKGNRLPPYVADSIEAGADRVPDDPTEEIDWSRV
jgi:hypothetical protein